MIKNAYIHIPFCASKCFYCSFVSFCDLNDKEAYLGALKSQIKSEYKEEKLNTLYFGGGTPSLLSIDEFKSLLELFEFEHDAEITVEVNPDSVDFEYLSALRALGVNRLSIGTQTFDDKILKLINRRHSALQSIEAVKNAQKACFDNISLDFIYGLPSQTIEGFEADLKAAIDLGIQHVSLYGLKIEDDSYFGKNQPKNLPDNDLQADMYLKAIETLTAKGFEHYEISNFSLKSDFMRNSLTKRTNERNELSESVLRKEQHRIIDPPCSTETRQSLIGSSGQRLLEGFESRHNLNYWDANTYYGFGCGASGYSPLIPTLSTHGRINVRYQNETCLAKYIENPLTKISKEEIGEQDLLEESIFLGLRKMEGINTERINARFGIDFDIKYKRILKKYSEFFVNTDKGWALNIKGVLISNEILAEFIE